MAIVETRLVSCPSNRLERPVQLVVEAPREKEGPVLTLGRPGRAARFMQSSCCLRLPVEPAWTMHSHPNREQEIRPRRMEKDGEADTCRARHEPAPESLPVPVNDGEGSLWEHAAVWSRARQRP